MTGFGTIICHAECLGAWTAVWAPCRGTWPFQSTYHTLRRESQDVFGVAVTDYGRFVSRSDICGWRLHMDWPECVEATIENLVWLLYPKFAHYT
eukprot:6490556-Amphidinium_carterae.4